VGVSGLRNLKISTKLILGFGVVIVITVLLGWVALNRLSAVSRTTEDIAKNTLTSIAALGKIETKFIEFRKLEYIHVYAKTVEEKRQRDAKIAEIEGDLRRNAEIYQQLITNDDERRLWQDFQAAWQKFIAIHEPIAARSRELKTDDAVALLEGESRTIQTSVGAALTRLIDYKRQAADAQSAAATKTSASARNLIFTMLIAAVALAMGTAVLIARLINAPIRSAIDLSQRISAGHLDNEIQAESSDEVGTLLLTLGDMQSKLRTQIEKDREQATENSQIRAALDSVTAGVMVADSRLNVVYTNPSVETILRGAETEYRSELARLHDLRGTHTGQLQVGDRTLRLIATPVLTADGARAGTVIEWKDRTPEVSVEKEMETMLSAVLGGDLGRRITLQGKSGFFEAMSRSVNQLADNMAEMVANVKSALNEVNRGADEISQGNANLSQRTEQQSSSLEETASSMEEMTSTVKQNADNAGQANQLAVAARDQAEKGGAVVAKAVKAMGGINEASRKIADIIGVIDEIAFQTNLLALNAAVEAARAGEQGRGFAVVASEVRSLAGRSATAAKEIKDLIQDSVKKVEDGSVLVTQSGQTLEQIVSSVKKVSDIVAEIAAASREQSTGIEQVNRAVMQMDELTQQNAALVEEATAASKGMAERARDLNAMMARYTVGETHVAPVAMSKPNATPVTAPRVERRKANRPWSGAPGARKVSGDGAAAAADWQEF
jgi:methyl-accepting chemotaxis protein